MRNHRAKLQLGDEGTSSSRQFFTMDGLDEVAISTLKAANIGEDILPTLSREDIRDLFPGPEHFLRRKAIWLLTHKEEQGHIIAVEVQGSSADDEHTDSSKQDDPSTSKFLKLPSPEYVLFTDSELQHTRRTYFEQQRLGKEGDVTLSKELFCGLIRNTMTNMISIARASSDDYKYPTKYEVIAMGKRLVEYYPMIKDKSTGSRHEWAMDELRRIIEPDNCQYISEVQFYGVMKKVMKPPRTLNGVEHAIAVFTALLLLFPSGSTAPKKQVPISEAFFHVLTPSEDPDTYIHRCAFSTPVLLVGEENCMVVVGTTPVLTFDKDLLHEGPLYLLAYYYAFHLTYPKCLATLLSVLQTQVLRDAIHEQDATPSYKKAIQEWRMFVD
ncbi:hypothetical protein G5714_002559 [Onychostoma macrolepis]|uniref:Uncharacterized protein n=1 Tax=Onychostoma macrolepis TaxID=369639 RepID=A0A7J6D739_9TELE|nr:hypothetical protein G5714_002559 [Onychostoma macrolepis]